MTGRSTNVFCRTGAEEWRHVFRHDTTGLDADRRTLMFQEAWQANLSRTLAEKESARFRWEQLRVPLPELPGPARAYAFTYPMHQRESRFENIFAFEKRGAAEGTWTPIPHRPSLDYEAEVALLLHRREPERFGFLLANDLTDRGIQVRTYDRRHPARGFCAAKSFAGALRIGPLLVVGGPQLWPELEVTLDVNGQRRQHVRAHECLAAPSDFHEQAFASADAPDWALVLTGTTGGTVFQSPSWPKRIQLLVRSGFSMKRAREAWLRQFEFLCVGDRLEMKSEILGTSHATVVASAE